MMKKIYSFLPALTLAFASCTSSVADVVIDSDVMLDKVRGAWAGKMIGVMYGRPMEFQSTDTLYTDSIKWSPEFVTNALNEDDIYGQLNFMMTMEKYGQDVPIDSLAKNFAYAEFPLCHANLQARKNYFDGIPAAELSFPANSIHCEDIDFQIECDFIGFINPCMPQASNAMCEKVGAIMSAADGLYAGMFVSAMHTQAYMTGDIDAIISEALKTIPEQSGYARCIRDVIEIHRQYPDDWHAAWRMLKEKWAPYDVCTPYHSFNIDAKLNGAYVVTGLLYGGGDWFKTMDITVRCGQDTDCNTATAAAILGLIQGYDAIPDVLKSHIPVIADELFLHTDYSYNKAVEQTIRFIGENVEANGGEVKEHSFHIKPQKPLAAQYVKGFDDLKVSYLECVADKPAWTMTGEWSDFVYGDGDYSPYIVSNCAEDVLEINFNGSGIALLGSWNIDGGVADVYIDGKKVKTIDTYYVTEAGKYEGNRAYLFYVTDLEAGDHTLRLVNTGEHNAASSGDKIYVEKALIYQ